MTSDIFAAYLPHPRVTSARQKMAARGFLNVREKVANVIIYELFKFKMLTSNVIIVRKG